MLFFDHFGVSIFEYYHKRKALRAYAECRRLGTFDYERVDAGVLGGTMALALLQLLQNDKTDWLELNYWKDGEIPSILADTAELSAELEQCRSCTGEYIDYLCLFMFHPRKRTGMERLRSETIRIVPQSGTIPMLRFTLYEATINSLAVTIPYQPPAAEELVPCKPRKALPPMPPLASGRCLRIERCDA